MKKIFTLLAFLTCFLGAKAEWVTDYEIDYSTKTGFPFYVMGYVPEWVDGVMTDLGGLYEYAEKKDDSERTSDIIVKTQNGVEYYRLDKLPGDDGNVGVWHQYFIADGIPTELDGAYTVTAMVKASEACSINVNMGWGWGSGEQAGATVAIGTEWAEVTWEYTGIAGTSCNLVAQPNTSATIEWKWLKVTHNKKESRPTVWQEWLTNDGKSIVPGVETTSKWMGDAETPWGDLATVKFDDQTQNYLVCAWSKEKGVNMNEKDGWDPFPATIEEDPDKPGNHVFVCHGNPATTEGDASAWDNQFWIQSPKSWKSGEQLKIHFRYKASTTVKTNTQIHKQNPSDYLIWHAIGDITFTTEWQEFDGTMTMGDDMAGGWSIAFNLNPEVKDAVDFYFDDLSWQSMKLDEGYFVASSNAANGIEYDFDNATEFEKDDDLLVATVGTAGKKDTWVTEVMISTVRGNDAAFKGATLKPSGAIVSGEWLDYAAGSLAKIKLPAAGVWTISLDTESSIMKFDKVEGDEEQELPEINPNPTEIVVHGQERDDLADGTNQDGSVKINEEEGGTGQAWDNQFFLVANRVVAAGETTVLTFKYRSSVDAKTTTQCHGEPGGYIHWAAIGDVNFVGGDEWQEFSKTFTIPNECDGSEGKQFKSIAFNMAEIKGACDYYIKDVVWKLEDGTESLIDQTGTKNFYVKEGAGTTPHEFGTEAGIINVKEDAVKANSAIYNLAGQRVSKDYKGIVVKDGKKFVVK